MLEGYKYWLTKQWIGIKLAHKGKCCMLFPHNFILKDDRLCSIYSVHSDPWAQRGLGWVRDHMLSHSFLENNQK